MKSIICVMFILSGIANAQWLLPDLYLPDSFSVLTDIYELAYNTAHNKLYVAGLSRIVVIDGMTNQKIAKITLPIYVFSGRLAYNSNNNKLYAGGGKRVIVIDGAADTILKTIWVKDSITGVLYNPQYNKIFVSHSYDTVTVISGANDSVIATIGVGRSNLSLLGFNSSGTKLYVGISSTPYSVAVINVPNSSLITKISISSPPIGFCYNSVNNKAYTGLPVVIIDGIGDSVITTLNGTGSFCDKGLVYNWLNNCIYAVRHMGTLYDTVQVIDGASDSIIARIRVYDAPYALTFNPNDNKVYCSNEHSKNVSIISCATNTVIATISTDPYPRPVIYASTNNKIYCGNARGPSVTVIDGTTNSKVATVKVGSYNEYMVYNSVSKKIYCTELQWTLTGYYPGILHVINANNNQPITSITVGYRPMGLTYNPTNNKVYCANYNSGTVSVISGVSDSVIATVTVGIQPRGLCYNSVNNRVYCANEISDNIKVIDGVSNTVIATIPAGNRPWNLFYHSGRNKIYSIDSTTITVIDGASNTRIKTMPTALPGFCFGYNSNHDKLYIGEMVYSQGGFVGGIDVIDCNTDSIIKFIFTGSQVRSICYNPNTDKFYAVIGSSSGSGSGRIEIYNGANDSLVKTIYLNSFPTPSFYNSVNNKIYCGTDRHIVVIDGNTDSIITTFNKRVSTEFCYNPARNYLYGSFLGAYLVVIADEMVNIGEERNSEVGNSITVAPNPFNRQTKIRFKTAKGGETIAMKIYNILGECVKNLKIETHSEAYEMVWDGTDDFNRKLGSGVYFLKVEGEGYSESKKIILTR